MKKKPRKPKSLYWYNNTLSIDSNTIMSSTFGSGSQSRGELSDYVRIPLPAAKKLWKWLKQATDYLEMKEKKK